MATSVAAALAYYREHWNDESYPKPPDMPYALIFACIFPLVRYILDKSVFERLGQRFILGKSIFSKDGSTKSEKHSAEVADREALLKTHVKFKESCWKSAYFISSLTFALVVSYGEPWLKETKYFWIGPGSMKWPEQTMKLKLKFLYAYVGGFYTYSIFALIFWETRRKDWIVHMTHHICCVVLFIVSYMFRVARMFSITVAIHDASDVLLEFAKMSKYSNFEVCANVFFLLFAASWVVLRLWWYPRNVLYSGGVEVIPLLDKENYPLLGPRLYYFFNFSTILLFVLHSYWWILITRVIYKQFDAGRLEGDVRSDESEEE
eukprot:TRINITY_DN20831_c0_g1_i1.p1 TRINITY_DN20831_c0_g1~~TRINITY_DN20831_c0_g1_i1.p1  ORF type:complete len:320 (+),score=25.66 TRINITY_DN20831_c0_g1_i1:188-1147(+)